MTDAFSLYNTLVILMGLIGALMAGALLYTTASANITERYVELGSLRAAGMGAGMLSRLAAVENLLVAVGGLVPGVFAGWLLARYFMAAYENDQMRLSLQLALHPSLSSPRPCCWSPGWRSCRPCAASAAPTSPASSGSVPPDPHP